MVSSVRSRLNHYEILGVAPTATEDEIRQAFERRMSECRWDPMAASARICIAYETLSNRFKRTDYDRSIGVQPKPQPRLSTMTVTQERWAPFIASAPTNALGQAARDAAAEPHVTARPDRQGRAGSKAGSFIAASLRELARPRPRVANSKRRPQPEERRQPSASLDPQLRQILAANSRDSEDRPLDWKQPAIAVGGFVVAAGLIGAFAGLSLKDDVESAQTALPVPIGAPAPKQHAKVAAASALPFATPTELRSESQTRPVSRRHAPAWARPRAAASEAVEIAPVGGEASADLGNSVVAADNPAPQPVVAGLPLSDSVVARTIDRIGYSCGQVTSSAAAPGGGFRVSCSSGQTYDATRVRGRYHFRRSH